MNSPVADPRPSVDDRTLELLREAQATWRTELADLGGRNSLMWHRELPTGTIDFTVAHPGGVAKLLAGRTTLLSELVRESVALGEARRRVAAIRAKALELQREHGMSTLFLAVGMASWQLARAPIPPRAPVLLRGARIHPTDATHRDYVLRLDDDVVFNPALEHYLRGERELELDGHELARLSAGRHGFDPRPTYDALEGLCAGIPQFGIGPQLVLSTYPLAKLPLVAELSGPVDQFANSTLLLDLVKAQGRREETPATDPPPGDGSRPARMADNGHQQQSAEPAGDADLSAVLPADRSQRAVLGLLARDESVVVDAVAGTGRTQTVVNAVAQTISRGGAVLVTAEQRRALEDVTQRMRDVGLGDLVLDIRETPAAARRAAATLINDLDRHHAGPPSDSESADNPQEPADDLQTRADQSTSPLVLLRSHEKHLHGTREPWGVSLAQTQDVLTRLAALRHPPASHVRLAPDVLARLTPASLVEVRDALTRAITAGAWKRRSEDPWFGAQIRNSQEAERAAAIVNGLVGGRFSEAREEINRLSSAVGLPAPANLKQWSRTFDLLRQVRDTLDVFTPQVYEGPLEELVRATDKGSRSGREKVPATARLRLRRQAKGLLRPGTPPPDLSDRLAHALDERTAWQTLAGRAARPSTPRGWEDAAQEYAGIASDLSWLADALAPTVHGKDIDTTHLDLLLERLVRLDAHADRLPVVAGVHGDLQPLRDRGLGALVDDLARRGVLAEDVEAEAELVYWASVHDQINDEGPHATSAELRRAVSDLAAERQVSRDRARAAARDAARAGVDAALAAHPAQEDALRAVVDAGPPLRLPDLLAAAPDLVPALRPCWVASPLTVPATIPAGRQVELLVVDEAHLVPLAHAVPALVRARRALIVGDSGGLPGEPFVSVVDEHAHPRGGLSESTLAAAAEVLPTRRLGQHYRSLDARMVPQRSATLVGGFPGVLLSSRLGLREAEDLEELIATLVDSVLDHARRQGDQSLAVLIDDSSVLTDVERALRARVRQTPDLAGALREDSAEPFLLATVERAAGEVRDRVIVALTGRPDLSEAWAASALGAARRQVVVVTDGPVQDLPDSPGLRLVRETVAAAAAPPDAPGVPDALDDPRAPGDGHRAPEDDRGAGDSEQRATGGSRRAAGSASTRSALVDDLAERLRAEDLTVRSGFGSGPQRIELVVDDPDEPGHPLLAIDTDAHPTADGLDVDRLTTRPAHLRRLGWTPVRVWTTDVFRDPAREVARIVDIARRASRTGTQ